MSKAFADSEYGCLREALLCAPPDTNFIRDNRPGMFFPNVEEAKKQHLALIDVLEGEGVRCQVMSANPNMYYQSYMRDSYVVTPWGLLLSKMGFHKRSLEPEAVRKFATASGMPVWRNITEGTLEGGDIQLLSPGHAVVGSNGNRTTMPAALQVKSWFEEKGWDCRVIRYPPNYVHLDVAMGILDSKNIITCSGALQRKDKAWLRSLGFNLHTLPASSVDNMACNVVALGKKRILSHAHNKSSHSLLRELGFQVLEVDISQFVANRGGVHCLVNPLYRDSAYGKPLRHSHDLKPRLT